MALPSRRSFLRTLQLVVWSQYSIIVWVVFPPPKWDVLIFSLSIDMETSYSSLSAVSIILGSRNREPPIKKSRRKNNAEIKQEKSGSSLWPVGEMQPLCFFLVLLNLIVATIPLSAFLSLWPLPCSSVPDSLHVSWGWGSVNMALIYGRRLLLFFFHLSSSFQRVSSKTTSTFSLQALCIQPKKKKKFRL